jgi:DEAD/DEAH box helicase domain-containing protein
VLLARRHPLDRYLLDHPETLVGQPVEAIVLNPGNPYVLAPQLAAAAQELPLTEGDAGYFGPTTPALMSRLEHAGSLRRRPGGWYWTGVQRAVDQIDLRSVEGAIDIVEAGSGRVLGVADRQAADSTLHEGAVYLHQGETYLSEGLDPDGREVLVRAAHPGYLTQARRRTSLSVLEERRSRVFGRGRLGLGAVDVRSRVTGYLRRDAVTGRVWDETPLDLPERRLRTTAVWWCLDASLVPEDVGLAALTAGAHAAEHAGLNLLPAFAPCDPWDLGGSFSLAHPDTGELSVFGFDTVAGGAGFAEYGYELAATWLPAVADRIAGCDCTAGCPACVVSAACGSYDSALDKRMALTLLSVLLGKPEQVRTDRGEG